MKQHQQSDPRPREIIALKVHQWLHGWDKVIFDAKEHRRRPDDHYYMFTLPASELRALSGIQRRTTEGRVLGSKDLGIQRRHDEKRSEEIRDFVHYGYPWSDLSEVQRQSGEFNDLRKPGWLPTAIVVNILKSGDKRHNLQVAETDLVTIIDSDISTSIIRLPIHFSGPRWRPNQLPPIEVIDGQHRLWAFEEKLEEGEFDLPVVAFHGLDISWQAYLFWTINIRPKRINPSLAFDLYPLLRTENWLERFEGHSIYRETRAQELTEALWAHPESPWYKRINMLGETGLKQPMVTQAAWIRSLMATYIKASEGKRVSVGGLFGAPVGKNDEALPWTRAQQAAFLIHVGQKLQASIRACKESWAKTLRAAKNQAMLDAEQDLAFTGPHTLLSTDQGIRGVLYVTNDLCFVRTKELELENWIVDGSTSASEEGVTKALKSLKQQRKVKEFLSDIADSLAKYDWRTSSAPGLTEDEQIRKAALRGSGGYKELRRQLLKHLSNVKGSVGKAAEEVLDVLGYVQE